MSLKASFLVLALGALGAFGFGCAASATDSGNGSEGVVADGEALTGLQHGCHVDCPKCHPGEVCPKYACILVCPNDKTPCGDATCGRDEVCCNASCGICTPPDGVCTQEICSPAPAPLCATDTDCQVVADYCTGCDCRALASGESLPVCDGPGVRCFADPCMNHVAACVGGQCVVQ